MKKAILSMVIVMASAQAFADKRVTCVDAKKGAAKLSYTFDYSSNPSARQTTDVAYSKNGNLEVISFIRLAQYTNNKLLIHQVFDDFFERPTLVFNAVPAIKIKGEFGGVITEVNPATGKASANHKVKCKITNL